MRRLLMILMVLLGLGHNPVVAQQTFTIPEGHFLALSYHDVRDDLVPGLDPASVGTARAGPTNATTKSPASFPRETPADRAASKAKQKDTIAKELSQEESMLADARKKLSEQEAIRTGDEKNYAKVLERLKPYKDTVEVHEKNVEALKRELGNLSR